MRKLLFVFVLLFFVVAYFTKPDDKTCIIDGAKAVWGDMVPDVYKRPDMFENFMNLISKDVRVKDWVFLKQVQYHVNDGYKTVAFGGFRHVFAVVSPLERNAYIPKPSKSETK